MKVDIKIVPIEVEEKSGWFSTKKKKMHQLRYTITLTDVEKAIIEKAGLREYVYLEVEQHTPDHSYSEMVKHTIDAWFYRTVESYHDYDTLIEAQAASQELKENLVKLKNIMDNSTEVGTEESFEL